MTDLVLTTKLFAPPPRSNLISRTRLVDRPNIGFQPGRRLILVSAPAGFGKTTLVSEWINLDHSDKQVAWISLNEGDNNPNMFCRI